MRLRRKTIELFCNCFPACPDKALYYHPLMYYHTKSSERREIKKAVLELTETGNVTLWVQIPEADPPVHASISAGQSLHRCTGLVGNHSECKALFSFDKPGNSKVNVTLTHLAMTTSTTTIDCVNKYPPPVADDAHSTPPVAQGDVGISMWGITAAVLVPLVVIAGLCIGVFFYLRRRKKEGKLIMSQQKQQPASELGFIKGGYAPIPESEFDQGKVGKYLSDLRRLVTNDVLSKNHVLNETFGVESEGVFYVDLAMASYMSRDVDEENVVQGAKEYVTRTVQSVDTKKDITIDKMFQPVHGVQKPRRVLLLGGAGMGKTTVSHVQILSVAEDESGEIRATYYFECRSLTSDILRNKSLSLADLFFLRHGPAIPSETTKVEILEYLHSNQSCIQITVEGLDELPRWEKCNERDTRRIVDMNDTAQIEEIIYNLIMKRLLPDANVLVTSQPTRSIKTGDFDKVIIALGFPESSIQDCLLSLCRKDEDIYNKVIEYIEQNGLPMYCVVPLTNVLLGTVLGKELSLKAQREKPFEIDSMTRLYSRVTLKWIWRKHQTLEMPAKQAVFDLTNTQKESFGKLAALAASGMLGEYLVAVFNNKYLLDIGMSPEEENFGLLEVKEMGTAIEGDFLNHVNAYFIHLTVQEFLAALHVCATWEEKDITKLKHTEVSRLDTVRLYVTGLLGDPECQRLVRSVATDRDEDTMRQQAKDFVLALASRKSNLLLTLQCLREGCLGELVPDVEEQLLVLKKSYLILDLSYTPGGLLPHQMLAACYVLWKCQKSTGLDLRGNSIISRGVKYLGKAKDRLAGIRFLDLSENCIGDEGVEALEPILEKNLMLETLVLECNNIGDEGAKALAEAIKTCASLQSLNFRGNFITSQGVTCLAGARDNLAKMKILDLSANRIGDKGMKALKPLLDKHLKLETLRLDSNNIGDEGAKALAEAIKTCPSLKELELGCNNIGEEGAKALAEAIKTCRFLEELQLYSNNIGNEGAKALAEAIKNCPCLNELDMHRNYDITEVGAMALAEVVKECPKITLRLSMDRVNEKKRHSIKCGAEDRIILN